LSQDVNTRRCTELAQLWRLQNVTDTLRQLILGRGHLVSIIAGSAHFAGQIFYQQIKQTEINTVPMEKPVRSHRGSYGMPVWSFYEPKKLALCPVGRRCSRPHCMLGRRSEWAALRVRANTAQGAGESEVSSFLMNEARAWSRPYFINLFFVSSSITLPAAGACLRSISSFFHDTEFLNFV